ncbi:hypothetical protein FSP39_000139 [Pinctada imbricata]|uniref:Carbohydrate sulfotransferase 15 n=1 Tax=Pinctada imbricata TaxID=66713 RepID=A0AA88XYC3_PINIB|nr:hypothetical protein FSP39_000139 [Pinctada imbricata]
MIHFLNAEGRYYAALPNVTSEYAGNGSSFFWREVWSHPGLDILGTPQFKFLPNFKNPCWYEPLVESNVYQNNKFAVVSMNARRSMMELMETWTDRLTKDKNAKRLRCLPYFMIVGQPKCASTDIYKKIMKHPDAVPPPIKELHWWSRNRQGRRINYTDIIPLTQYIDMFDKAALYIEKRSEEMGEPDIDYHKIITGDGSVSVFWENDDWWHFPENQGHTEPRYTNADYIHHVIPNAKIIVSVRNPTDSLLVTHNISSVIISATMTYLLGPEIQLDKAFL